MQKQKQEGEREKKKSDRITWSLFPSIPWKNLSVLQTLDLGIRVRIEAVQVRKEYEGFE